MEGQKNSIKQYPVLYVKIKQPKTMSGPISSLTFKKNHIGSAVSEIFRYRQKSLLLYIIGYKIVKNDLEILLLSKFSSNVKNN